MPVHFDKDMLMRVFSTYGKIVNIHIEKLPTTKNVGYVYYDDDDSGRQALQELKGIILMNDTCPLKLSFAKKRVNTEKKTHNTVESKCVNVTNVPSEWSEVDVTALFSKFGDILFMKLYRTEDNGSIFGRISFNTSDSAEIAAEKVNLLVIGPKRNTIGVTKVRSSRCKFYMKGKCNKGVTCLYIHDSY